MKLLDPHRFWMKKALAQAQKALACDEVPIGAVLVCTKTQNVLFEGHNLCETLCNPTAHAEMLALKAGFEKLKNSHLDTCTLYVTLEPCPMCAQAISFARLHTLVWGSYNPKGGGVTHGPSIFDQPTCFHKPSLLGGVAESETAALLKTFFAKRRPAML